MSILKVDNLTLAYGSKKVVKNCSFEVERGEVLVILGSSGDGKTSLLKAIGGLMKRSKGAITFEDKKVLDPSEQLIAGHDLIRLVNQDFDLSEHHTVEENIRLKILKYDKEYQAQRIKSLLRLMRLTAFKKHKSTQISGGQQQRLSIARALADEPEMILLDEPFNQLDFQTKDKISKHLKRYLKKENIAAIMVTHNGLEAMEWADRILYIEKGKVKRIDTPREFFNNPKSEKEANFFGELNKLKIKDKVVFFRPSFFAEKKSKELSLKLKIEFISQEFLGWYSIYTFSNHGERFRLFSTYDISGLREIFVKPLAFND
ncbi:MAG: iron(III) transport system ATP-binding protein [Arenicella sp.]|jgi:iron(III) transport system ATP-binding protein